jgi:hypothetical protein
MIKNYLRALVVSLLLCCVMQANLLHAQDMQKQYAVVNRSLSEEAGNIHLDEVDGDGIAWISGKEFTQGTIEFDIRGREEVGE